MRLGVFITVFYMYFQSVVSQVNKEWIIVIVLEVYKQNQTCLSFDYVIVTVMLKPLLGHTVVPSSGYSVTTWVTQWCHLVATR